MIDIEAARKSITAALVNALDSPTIEALGNIFAQPSVVHGRSYSSRVAEVLVPRLEALDYKWLDPECIGKGCQSLVWKGRYESASLVWKGRYESAVKGRADFRNAYREAHSPAATSAARTRPDNNAHRDALQKIADSDQHPDTEDTAAELREIARNALEGRQ